MVSLRSKIFVLPVGVLVVILVALTAQSVATTRPASANLELIAASCNGRAPAEAPGQLPGDGIGNATSDIRALWATGFLVSLVFDPTAGIDGGSAIVATFDPTVPSSKVVSFGADFTIVDGAGEGVDLVLSPGFLPDPDFPAFVHCFNLNG